MLNYTNYARRYRTKRQKALRITKLTPKQIGYNMGLVFEAINSVSENKNVICLAHYEEYKDKNGDSISYRYKSTGNMVNKICQYLSNCWKLLKTSKLQHNLKK